MAAAQPRSGLLARRRRTTAITLPEIADQLALGVAVVDAEHRYLAANPALCRMLGRDTGRVVGHALDELTFIEDIASAREPLEALLEGRAGSSSYETRYARPNGEVVYARVTAVGLLRPSDSRLVVQFVHDTTEQHLADEQRSELAQLLIRAQEDERRRIADEVHDDPLQSLIALSIQLQVLETRIAEPEALSITADIRKSVAQAVEQMRSLLFELHPPALHLGGLSESLREYVRRYEDSGGPQVQLEDTTAIEPREEEAVALFRIIAEALTNARKHADARHVTVGLVDSQGGISLSISDDGVGFSDDPNMHTPGHIGVMSMRERAQRAGGSFEITSRPGAGTTVRVWVPRGS